MPTESMFAAPGEPTCGAGAEGHDTLICRLPPHPHEADDVHPHAAMIDGSMVQWIGVPADQSQPNAELAEHGGA